MKNKLVIFDCFGVIFDEIAPVFFRRHFDEETARTLKDKYFIPADLGEITREELFDRMSAELGMKKEDILSEWNELIRLRPYMVDEIEKIREKADVALLSNAPLGFVEKIFSENGIMHLFDKMFISCNLKMAKPDPKIYLHCISSFGKEYEEIYMVDDSLPNVEKLGELGIIGVHFKNAESLCQIKL